MCCCRCSNGRAVEIYGASCHGIGVESVDTRGHDDIYESHGLHVSNEKRRGIDIQLSWSLFEGESTFCSCFYIIVVYYNIILGISSHAFWQFMRKHNYCEDGGLKCVAEVGGSLRMDVETNILKCVVVCEYVFV